MINVAIIGAGIGAKHLQAYLTLPNDFNVMYVIDKDISRAQELVDDRQIHISAHLDDALNDPAIDLIDLCVPPYLHVRFTLQALAANKDVVCEKPLTTSLAGAAAVQNACAETGRTVFPVFQYRWAPEIRKLRRLVDAGLTGKPQAATIETHWCRDAEYYATPWRGTWEGEQGGAVLGHAIHNHDLLCHLMGNISALSAVTATRANPIETEDCAAIIFEMESGALATSSVSLGAARDETRLRFVFENLTVTSGTEPYAPGIDKWSFVVRNSRLKKDIEQILEQEPSTLSGFSGYFTEIARHLRNQVNEAVSLADGMRSIELVTAIYHAARSGERVTLPLGDEHPLHEGWIP